MPNVVRLPGNRRSWHAPAADPAPPEPRDERPAAVSPAEPVERDARAPRPRLKRGEVAARLSGLADILRGEGDVEGAAMAHNLARHLRAGAPDSPAAGDLRPSPAQAGPDAEPPRWLPGPLADAWTSLSPRERTAALGKYGALGAVALFILWAVA